MKRLISMVLCILLIASFAVVTQATDTVSLTIEGNSSGHTYAAYQIFVGDVGNSAIANAEWGSGLKKNENDEPTFFAAIKADTYQIDNSVDPNHAGTTMKAELGDVTSIDMLIEKMTKWRENRDRIDYFAHFLMYGSKSNATQTAYTHLVEPTSAAVAKSTEKAGNIYEFYNLEEGYYLIVDITNAATNTNKDDLYTKFLVNIVADEAAPTLKVKGDIPSVDKKVSNKLDSGYTKDISNQFNLTHYYQWEGTVPSNINNYDHYKYVFTDTLSAGLTFGQIESVVIQMASGSITCVPVELNEQGGFTNDPTKVQYYFEKTTREDGTTVIELGWNDLLAEFPQLEASDKIVVKYSATLNEKSIVDGNGTENEVELLYSNSPNDYSKTGVTPPSEANVYSFGLDLTKVATGDTTKKLQGAKFYLYHLHTEKTDNGYVNIPVYAKVTSKAGDTQAHVTEWVEDYQYDEETNTIVKDAQGNNVRDNDASFVPEATVFESDENGKILIYGLKADVIYYLVEIEPPQDYNKLNYDPTIQITGYEVDAEDKITKITYKLNGSENAISSDSIVDVPLYMAAITVDNKEGTTLPSTGGMGTTVLYIAGGIMVLAAIVLLVTKKRMTGAE